MSMKKRYNLDQIQDLEIDIKLPSIVFLKWGLWAGKTTLSQHIIRDMYSITSDITSPTYTYYNKYISERGEIYHFDLYRISDYEEFIYIWWEEILDNNTGLILIEWPDILKDTYEADITIDISITWNANERELSITKRGE